MAVPRLLVEIAASLGTFQADFGRASTIAEQNARRISKSIDDAKASVVTFGKSIAAAVGIPLSIGGAIALFDTIKEKVIEDERSVAQLNATLRATGSAAGQSRQAIDEIGAGIRGKTVFNDEEIRQAATALLRFRSIQGDAFKQALEQTPDLATALGTTLPNAATILGKALIDPGRGLRALKEVGVQLSEQMIDQAARMVETGNRAGAYKLVLDELKKSIGGSSEADNAGVYGSSRRLSRALDELAKTGGKKLFEDRGSEVDDFTAAIERLRKKAEETHPTLKTLLTGEAGRSLFGAFFGTESSKEPPAPRQQVSGKITLPDGRTVQEAEALQGRINQSVQQASDQQYKDREIALRRAAAQADVFDVERLAQTRSTLDRQSQLYTAAYARDEISAQEFFDRQRKTAADSAEAQLAALGARGKSLEALLAPENTFIKPEERAGIVQQIATIATQQFQIRRDQEKELTAIDIRQVEALRQLRDEYERLDVTLKELSGDTVGAAAQGFDQQNRRLRDRLNAESQGNNPAVAASARGALVNLDSIRQRTVQQAALNKVQEDFGIILDAVGNAQARIDLQFQTGAISELDSLNQKASAAKALIPELQRVADAYTEIANRTGDHRALIAADSLKLKIEQLGAAADAVAKKFSDVFVNSFADAITAAAVGGQKLSDIARNLEKSIVSGISQIASKNIGETLFGKNGPLGGVGKFFGDLFGKKGQDVGTPPLFPPEAVKAASDQAAAALTTATSATELGASATILTTAGTSLNAAAAALQAAAGTLSASSGAGAAGGLGGLFPGGTSTGFTPDASTSFTPEAFDLFGGFADGTDFAPGGMAWVGERGKELVNLPRGAQVIPNDVLRAKRFERQGGNSQTNHVTVNVTVAGSTSSATAGQVGAAAGKSVRRALDRYA